MKKHGKKYKNLLQELGGLQDKVWSFEEGIGAARKYSYARFDESFTVTAQVGINPEKSDHAFRGSVLLPHQFGKQRVVAFAKGEQADLAKQAGADFVGAEELIAKILDGWIDFEYAVATPDLMGMVGQTAKILGPKGLLPTKKNNTVALQLEPVIKELKSGLRFFKNTRDAHVHFTIGKKSQTDRQLYDNLVEFVRQLAASRPSAAKGVFIKSLHLSTTMGLSMRLNVNEINK
jgi:large subunit ribosomal protein L1